MGGLVAANPVFFDRASRGNPMSLYERTVLFPVHRYDVARAPAA